jgi:hypothetical protein
MANSGRNPTTWDEYEGRASVSNNSLASTDIGEDTALLEDGDDDLHGGGSSDRRRYFYPCVRPCFPMCG